MESDSDEEAAQAARAASERIEVLHDAVVTLPAKALDPEFLCPICRVGRPRPRSYLPPRKATLPTPLTRFLAPRRTSQSPFPASCFHHRAAARLPRTAGPCRRRRRRSR